MEPMDWQDSCWMLLPPQNVCCIGEPMEWEASVVQPQYVLTVHPAMDEEEPMDWEASQAQPILANLPDMDSLTGLLGQLNII